MLKVGDKLRILYPFSVFRGCIIAMLVCVCIALTIGLVLEHQKRVEAQEQNVRMEKQLKEMSVQVNEIWAEYIATMKRIQQHG